MRMGIALRSVEPNIIFLFFFTLSSSHEDESAEVDFARDYLFQNLGKASVKLEIRISIFRGKVIQKLYHY